MMNENICTCLERRSVKNYCKQCKGYICSECRDKYHAEHKAEVVDLAEKCQIFLENYQHLMRQAGEMMEKLQSQGKQESVDKIVDQLKSRIVMCRDQLQGDILKGTQNCTEYLSSSPLILEFQQKKADLSRQEDNPLQKIKNELTAICKELLMQIIDGKYETADHFTEPEKLKSYEENIQKMTDSLGSDLNFIRNIKELKKTHIEYRYNPTAVLGMIKVDTQVKKPQRIIQFDREKNLLNIFYLESRKKASTSVSCGFILPFRFISIEVCNNVYLSGGDNDNGKYLKSLYFYDELRGTLIPQADMYEPRSRHSLVGVDSKNRFYALGGDCAEGVKASCECYHIKENRWTMGPDLNLSRCCLSSCLLGNFIYAIGGWNGENLYLIEKLDVMTPVPDKWEVLKFDKKHLPKCLQCPGVAVISESEILIFGGYRNEEDLVSDSYVINVSEMITTQAPYLERAESFITSEIKVHNGTISAFGYDRGGIHTRRLNEDVWEYISQDDIINL